MGPGYFVIAILGCADGGAPCTPVATLQTRYENAGAMLGRHGRGARGQQRLRFPDLACALPRWRGWRSAADRQPLRRAHAAAEPEPHRARGRSRLHEKARTPETQGAAG